MIDFVKLAYCGPLTKPFYDAHIDDFSAIVNTGTGQIDNPWRYMEHGNFKIAVFLGNEQENNTDGRIEVRGSLHKNFFDGHNYEFFDYDMLDIEIELLCNFLGIPASQLKVQQLEFGVNIELWESPLDCLDRRLICMANKPFIPYAADKKGKRLGYFSGSTCILKLYDKGLQYNLERHLLRIELRCKRSEVLAKMNINVLNDLRSRKGLGQLGLKLKKMWDSVLLYDAAAMENWMRKTRNPDAYHNARSYAQWREWKRDLSRSVFNRKKKAFQAILSRDGDQAHLRIDGLLRAEMRRAIIPIP